MSHKDAGGSWIETQSQIWDHTGSCFGMQHPIDHLGKVESWIPTEVTLEFYRPITQVQGSVEVECKYGPVSSIANTNMTPIEEHSMLFEYDSNLDTWVIDIVRKVRFLRKRPGWAWTSGVVG